MVRSKVCIHSDCSEWFLLSAYKCLLEQEYVDSTTSHWFTHLGWTHLDVAHEVLVQDTSCSELVHHLGAS